MTFHWFDEEISESRFYILTLLFLSQMPWSKKSYWVEHTHFHQWRKTSTVPGKFQIFSVLQTNFIVLKTIHHFKFILLGVLFLLQILVNDVPADMEDKDVILDNDIFTDRRSFLSFCEENNYQFDTLRRAKHSSMMILYHLHKMTTITKQRTCSLCHNDVVLEWRCEICPGLDVCSMCYSKEGEGCHVHPLIPHVLEAYCETKNKQELENRKAFKVW